MKKTKLSLKESSFRFLFEQESDSPENETEEDTSAESDDSEDSGMDGADDSEKSNEPEPEVTEEDEESLEDSIDAELEEFFINAETDARKSSVVNQEKNESKKFSLKTQFRMLFEGPAEDIDLKHFASETARLVKNYQNLIDWETVILNKANKFIDNHYGPDTAKMLMDILEDEYQLVKKQSNEEEDSTSTPIAVGARDQSPT